MSPKKIKTIGGALTIESGSNVSGRVGVNRGAQPGPYQANPEGGSVSQAVSGSTATRDLHEVQIANQFPRKAQGDYLVDGAIDTHLLGTDPIGSQKGKNGPEKQKFLCAECRKKRWVIDSEAGCAAEMTRFTRCMFCVVEKRDERARMQLQAALLKEMEYLRNSIEQSLCTFEAKIEERTPARSGEASHSRAGEAAAEDLRKELSSLREHVHRELDGLRSKVARSTPQPKKKKTVASPPGAARSEADPPGDASKACSPGGDAEAVIEDAYARMVKKAARPSVRLERQVPQAPPREEQPSNKPTKKRRRRRRRRKRSVTKEVAPAARQQCECTRAPNLLVGDSLVAREAGRFFSQLRPANRAQAFPGARVKKVTEEVAKLNLHRDSTLLLTVGGNDLFLKNRRCGSSERIVRDFDQLIKTAKSKTSRLIVVGLVPRDYRSGEDYSRAIGVNRRLETLCQSYSIRFIDPWATFYGRVNLFQRDGTHFSSHGARVFARLLNKRLFKPVASRSWGPGRAEPRAPLAGPPSKGVTAKRAPPRKPPPEAPTKVATVPPPSPPPLVMDLVQSPHMEGSSLAPGGSGSPDPPSGPSKRPRSPPTGESVSPTQGPSQKRRCDQDGRDEDEPNERGPDPSPSGNGSPSVVVVSP